MRDIFFDALEQCLENSSPVSDEGAYAIFEFVDALMECVDRLYYPQIKAYINALSERVDISAEIIDEADADDFADDISF